MKDLLRVLLFDEVEVSKTLLPSLRGGKQSSVNPVGICDDQTPFCLTEDLVECHHTDPLGTNNVPENGSRPNGRQLIDIPHQNEGGTGGDGPQHLVHEVRVDHGGLIQDDHISLQGVGLVPLKSPLLPSKFQQPMDGSGRAACRLAHAFGSPTGGSSQQDTGPNGLVDLDNGVNNGRLSGARTSCDHQNLVGYGTLDRLHLLGCQPHVALFLDPLDGLVRLNGTETLWRRAQTVQVLGNPSLRNEKSAQINRLSVPLCPWGPILDNDGALKGRALQGLFNGFPLHIQLSTTFLHQRFVGVEYMSFLGHLIQHVQDARLRPHGCVLLKTHLSRDGVGSLEADPGDVHGQTIGVLRNHRHGSLPILPVDLGGMGESHTVFLEKHHDASYLLLPGPRLLDHLQPFGADPFHACKILNAVVDHIQCLLPKGPDDAGRHHGSNPLDETRTQIPLNTPNGCGGPGAVAHNPELGAEPGMGLPDAFHLQHLAGRQGEQIAHNRNRFLGAGDHDLCHCIAALLVHIGDALDLSRQILGGGGEDGIGMTWRQIIHGR